MVRMPRRGPCRPPAATPVSVVLALTLVSSCGAPSDDAGAVPGILARIDGRTITQQEVEARVQGRLVELEIERYEILQEGLDHIIDQVLLEQESRSRGVTVDELVDAEVTQQVVAPSADEIRDFYEQNRAQLHGQTLERLRGSIETYLRQARVAERRAEFLDELRGQREVAVLLRPPTVMVAAEGPARGSAEAAVTIVEFSDFGCPYCKRAAGTLSRVLDSYADRVRLVYRHFPLQPDSHHIAEAASCADEQGKFWMYHDLLFAHQGRLDDGDLSRLAGEAGADTKAFRACLASGRTAGVVARDAAAAEAAGVNGTPAFFINGRPLSGAVPEDALRDAIEDALAETQA